MLPARYLRSRSGAAASPSSSDPYPLYPALDRNTIPWHTASGAWGPQVAIDSPTLPTTTRSVTVNTTGQFNTEAAVAGTEITIGTGWAGNTSVSILASDIDVIIPSGIAIGAVQISSFGSPTPYARIRIRGSTPGLHSGGRMGQLRAQGAAGAITDVVVDGIDLNGDSNYGGAETNQAFRCDVTRMAVLNCRVIAAGYTWLGGTRHLVIANSNWYHGAATRAQAGFVEGWGLRNTRGPITIIDSRIQGTRYVNVRSQSTGNTEELLYIGRSVLANAAEGQTLWVWEDLNLGPYTGEGGLIEDCDIYTHSAVGCNYAAEIRTSDVDWCEIKNNNFFGAGTSVFTQTIINNSVKGGGAATGNTFSTMTTLPSWGGPGDPTAVPLPAGLTLIDGEGVCPYGP
jgi:hypothetical protein